MSKMQGTEGLASLMFHDRLNESDTPAVLNKKIRRHHWWAEFQAVCPGWEAFFCYMSKDEILDYDRKIIWLRTQSEDPLFRWAHAAAHVMDHPDGMSVITDADEDAAELAARCWAAYSPPVASGDMSEVA